MSKMIQVRNVPEELHRKLKARAAAEGLSLSDYIKRELAVGAARPSFEEVDARVKARGERIRKRRGGPIPTEVIVDAIRSARDA
jgi:plasmid stability protein